jgi:hypothetical protein
MIFEGIKWTRSTRKGRMMVIYTPRGLKIRIPIPRAFALMNRLYPRVSPWQVLKTAEGFEFLPAMMAFAAGIVGLGLQGGPVCLAAAVGAARLAGFGIKVAGFPTFPGMISAAVLFGSMAGYGVFWGLIVILGFLTTGWPGVAAFFAGNLWAGLVSLIVEFRRARRYHRLTGRPWTGSELNFFRAYLFHASRIGAATDVEPTGQELEEEKWRPVFEEFAAAWPELIGEPEPDAVVFAGQNKVR